MLLSTSIFHLHSHLISISIEEKKIYVRYSIWYSSILGQYYFSIWKRSLDDGSTFFRISRFDWRNRQMSMDENRSLKRKKDIESFIFRCEDQYWTCFFFVTQRRGSIEKRTSILFFEFIWKWKTNRVTNHHHHCNAKVIYEERESEKERKIRYQGALRRFMIFIELYAFLFFPHINLMNTEDCIRHRPGHVRFRWRIEFERRVIVLIIVIVKSKLVSDNYESFHVAEEEWVREKKHEEREAGE